MDKPNIKLEKAAFGAGCFWGVEATFQDVDGVLKTDVGYMGGHEENPSYEEVCRDKTGHAETVYIEYDANQVDYETLLKVFWMNHNPTTLNRQGPDIGSQYRSVIFYYNKTQKKLAEASKKELDESGEYPNPIVTEIVTAPEFWKAEEYHQEYYKKRGIKKQCGL